MGINPSKGADGETRSPSTDIIRVMVVDDSAVIRGFIVRMLESEPDFEVVASVGNGEMAVSNAARHKVDVIVLDIEMPVMDGLTALPKIFQIDPNIKVIMASTLTLRNAEISFRAMQAGASDYIPKPSNAQGMTGSDEFRRELVLKIRNLGQAKIKATGATVAATKPTAAAAAAPAAAKEADKPKRSLLSPTGPIPIRKPGIAKPQIITVGSSTGGPQALFDFLKGLDHSIKLPIVITQHMPATFTTILAEHISRMTQWECAEAKDGEVLLGGRIYLAPGDYHMLIESKGAQQVLRLNQGPQENFCRPSVDPMLRSVVDVFGGHVFTVILTGMGSDGKKGGEVVVEAGGTVIAQDEKTSVVWGMPGAAAEAGICSAVLPLNELAPYVNKFLGSA